MPLAQPDPRVLRAASCGDRKAFQELVEAYRGPVLGYVGRLVRDPCLAEDLTQEVFLRVYQRLPSFSDRSLFTTWLFQVAKNRVIDELRAQHRRPELAAMVDGLPELEAAPSNGDSNELIEAIWQAVGQLKPSLKLPLLLRDVAGLTYLEIADVLEIELSLVKWRIYRAREDIQGALAQKGLGLDRSQPRPARLAPTGTSPLPKPT